MNGLKKREKFFNECESHFTESENQPTTLYSLKRQWELLDKIDSLLPRL